MPFISKFTQSSLFRYLIVGFSSFGVEFLAFSFFLYVAKTEALAANMLSLIVAFSVNFTLSNFWTFKAGKDKAAQKISKYLALVAINYVLNNALFYFLNTTLGINPVVTKVLVTGMQVVWNYLAYKFWVFKK